MAEKSRVYNRHVQTASYNVHTVGHNRRSGKWFFLEICIRRLRSSTSTSFHALTSISRKRKKEKKHFFLSLFSDRPLGNVVLGGFMFARGSGHEHWEDVKKNQKMFIQRWHPLAPADGPQPGGGGAAATGSGGLGGKKEPATPNMGRRRSRCK